MNIQIYIFIALIMFIIIITFITKYRQSIEYYDNINYKKYLVKQKDKYNQRLYNPESIKKTDISKEIEKCNVINETKKCSMLKNSKCGYCFETNRYLYGDVNNPLGFNNEPLVDVCPKDKWVLPGKDAAYTCTRLNEQKICSNVKDCGGTIGKASICGWCPIENKAMVRDKNGEPKYKNDKANPDKCEWTDPKKVTTLINGPKNCAKMAQDFPCLTPNPKTGAHSSLCYQDLWNKSGCKTNIHDKIVNEHKYKLWNKNSYMNVFNDIKFYFKMTKSKIYKTANKYNNLCFGKNVNPCDSKYIKGENGKRPLDCLIQLYNKSGCKPNGLLNPKYEHKWRRTRFWNRLKNNQRLYYSNKQYSNYIKHFKNKSDMYNSALTKKNFNSALWYNKMCYGKYPDIPISFNKPCWEDFILRLKTIHGIKYSNNRIQINNSRFRIGGRASITKSMYEAKYFPFWDYDLKLKKYWDNNWRLFKKIVLRLPHTYDNGNFIKFYPKCLLNNITNQRLSGHYRAYIFSTSRRGYKTIPYKFFKHPNYPYWAIINIANSF